MSEISLILNSLSEDLRSWDLELDFEDFEDLPLAAFSRVVSEDYPDSLTKIVGLSIINGLRLCRYMANGVSPLDICQAWRDLGMLMRNHQELTIDLTTSLRISNYDELIYFCSNLNKFGHSYFTSKKWEDAAMCISSSNSIFNFSGYLEFVGLFRGWLTGCQMHQIDKVKLDLESWRAESPETMEIRKFLIDIPFIL